MELPTLKERTDRYIRRVLRLNGGKVGAAAKVLGIGRATLYRWCEAQGLALSAKQESERTEQEKRRRIEYLQRPARTM